MNAGHQVISNDGPTPKQLGYRMPAEWEPHQATWVSWPHKEGSWPGKLESIERTFAEMVIVLSRSETVRVNVCDTGMKSRVQRCLGAAGTAGDVQFHTIPTDDAWCRDCGAVFIKRDMTGDTDDSLMDAANVAALAAIDFGFNSWGEKYPPYQLDNALAARMAESLGVPRFDGRMILEGGSIDVNGDGLLLTTESCLLNSNRNPHLGRDDIEQRLRDLLGIDSVLWLSEGIAGDDTDGHVDDLARFVSEDTIVTVVEENCDDVNYPALAQNLDRLNSLASSSSPALDIVPLPMPPPVTYEGERLPASYANFYIANTVVLVPAFHEPTDRRVIELLQSIFTGREVVAIDCTDLVWGLGAFHCLTQQVPACDWIGRR